MSLSQLQPRRHPQWDPLPPPLTLRRRRLPPPPDLPCHIPPALLRRLPFNAHSPFSAASPSRSSDATSSRSSLVVDTSARRHSSSWLDAALGRRSPLTAPSAGRRSSLPDPSATIQEEARRALESVLVQNKTGFQKWGVKIERRQQRARRGGPSPAAGGGGGGSGGGGGWFRWFSSGGFWDAAKQTILTILGIIAAFFLIANFNVLVAAAVNPLLAVLRQIRRALSFAVHCVSRGMSVPASGPKSTSVDRGNLAAVPANGRVGMSAKERVIRKWGMD